MGTHILARTHLLDGKEGIEVAGGLENAQGLACFGGVRARSVVVERDVVGVGVGGFSKIRILPDV